MHELRTFGGLDLRTEAGERVEALAGRTKCLALLVYLAVEVPNDRVPREAVAALLWPDVPDDRARASLRMALSQIRKATDPVLLAEEGTSGLGLARDQVRVDAIAFREALEAGEEATALELYRGDFLAGIHVKGARRFQRWADQKRGHLRQEAYEAALSVGASARAAGDLASAEEAFRRALDLGPLREEAARELIQTLADRGRTANAVQLYESWREHREAELEMAPSRELKVLVEELRLNPASSSIAAADATDPADVDAAREPGEGPSDPSVLERPSATADASADAPEENSSPGAPTPAAGEPSRRDLRRPRALLGALAGVALLGAVLAGGWYLLGGGDEAPPPAAGDRSVAVLPFETLGQARHSAFTDGIQTGVLTRLSTVADLGVTSRTSVMPYRDLQKPLPEIAGELGVSWIVRGEVQEGTDQVQVSARLLNAREDRQVWADSYRRRLTAGNVFAIQEEIARQIAEALQARLTEDAVRRLEERPTESLDAYRLYVKGKTQLDRRTEVGTRQAVALFRRALERDSSYALAWSGLSDALSILRYYDYAPADSVSGPAIEAARRAVELTPTSGEAHTSLGIALALRREGPEALSELQQAVELLPSYAEAYIWLGWLHLLLGNPEQALEFTRRAVELGPLAPAYHVFLAQAQLANGLETDALRTARRAREIQPEYGLTHFMEAVALHHLGRHAEAEEALERSRSLVPAGGTPTHREIDAVLAATRSVSGDTGGTRALRNRIDASAAPFSAGLVHAALGEKDLAFEAFRRTEDWGSFSGEHARYFFPNVLGPLRDDPRYEELIRKANRAWGLNPDGSLPDSVDVSVGTQPDG